MKERNKLSRPENGNRINKENTNWEWKIYEFWTQITEASFTERIQEMEERISGLGDMRELISVLVKNVLNLKIPDTKYSGNRTLWKDQT